MHLLSLFGQSPYYDYGPYYDNTNYNSESAIALSFGIMVFALVFAAAFYVLHAIFLGKIFKKAGVESWKAWVPVYNSWVMLELGDQKGYWAVVSLIPFVGIIGAIFIWIAMYQIGLNLGKEGAFVLLAIFLPTVWLIWLGADKSTWKGSPVHAASVPQGSAPAYQPPVEKDSDTEADTKK